MIIASLKLLYNYSQPNKTFKRKSLDQIIEDINNVTIVCFYKEKSINLF